MRGSIRWVILVAAALAVAGFLAKRHTAVPGRDLSGSSPRAEAQALLGRSEAAPERTTHGREFLKRVYSRSRQTRAANTEEAAPEIGGILKSKEDDHTKASRLLDLALTQPTEDNLTAVDHAVNLVVNSDYDLLRARLVDAQTPEAMHEILLADLLTRGNSIKLPALVDIARQPDHPEGKEARDLLELHLGEDHGTNWTAWLDAAKTHIAEHGE